MKKIIKLLILVTVVAGVGYYFLKPVSNEELYKLEQIKLDLQEGYYYFKNVVINGYEYIKYKIKEV